MKENVYWTGFVTILTTLVSIVIIGALLMLPVAWLWNACLVGTIAGVHEITWLQAWGIYVLFRVFIPK